MTDQINKMKQDNDISEINAESENEETVEPVETGDVPVEPADDISDNAVSDNETETGSETDNAPGSETETDSETALGNEPTPDGEPVPDSETEDKKGKVAEFFRSYGSALIFLCALLVACVMLGLAIGFGGDIYDKIAFIWIAAFVCELIAYLGHKSKKTLAALITVGVLAVCSVVAYGLELANIIP